MRGKFFKFRWLAGSAVVAAAVGISLELSKGDQGPPLPSPNAYDYFVRAGRQVSPWTVEALAQLHYGTNSVADLEEIVEANRQTVILVREGLQYESRVPPVSGDWMDQRYQEFGAFHVAMHTLEAESQLHLRNGVTNAAAPIF